MQKIQKHPWVYLSKIFAEIIMDRSDLHGLGHVKRVLKHIELILNTLSSDSSFHSDFNENKSKQPDLYVIYIAGWLHDVGRNYRQNKSDFDDFLHCYNNKNDVLKSMNHAQISAIIAQKFLKKELDCEKFRNYFINHAKNQFHDKKVSLDGYNALIRDFEEKYNKIEPLDDIILQKILTCIQEHSFSTGLKPSTIESEILSDADKLDALGAIGIYRTASYQNDEGSGISGMIRHFYEKLLRLNDKIIIPESKLIAEQRIEFMREYLEQLNKELKET